MTAAALHHRGHECRIAVHDAHQVDTDQAVPIRQRGIEDPADDGDARVVDQQVDSTEVVGDFLGEAGHLLGVGDVNGLTEHIGAGGARVLHSLRETRGVHVANR